LQSFFAGEEVTELRADTAITLRLDAVTAEGFCQFLEQLALFTIKTH
jgi:hypothetical protein